MRLNKYIIFKSVLKTGSVRRGHVSVLKLGVTRLLSYMSARFSMLQHWVRRWVLGGVAVMLGLYCWLWQPNCVARFAVANVLFICLICQEVFCPMASSNSKALLVEIKKFGRCLMRTTNPDTDEANKKIAAEFKKTRNHGWLLPEHDAGIKSLCVDTSYSEIFFKQI